MKTNKNTNPEHAALLIAAAIRLEIFPDGTRLREAYETAETASQMFGGAFLEDSIEELRQALSESYYEPV